jgi:hypothetical protein
LAFWGAAATSQQSNQQDDRSSAANKQQSQQNSDNDKQRGTSGRQSDAIEIPAALKKLDLKDDQKQEIKQILRKKREKLEQTWNDFHAAHMRAVELEATWVAAVRDALDEEKQQQFTQRHEERRQRAAEETQRARPEDLDDTENGESSRARDDNSERSSAPNDGQRRSNDSQANRGSQSGRGPRSDNSTANSESSSPDIVIFGVSLVSPEGSLDQQSTSQSQRQQCSEKCRKYQQALRQSWRDADRAHARMVDIEAEALASIENVLTDDQLEKLRESREEPQTSGEGQAGQSDSNQRSQSERDPE